MIYVLYLAVGWQYCKLFIELSEYYLDEGSEYHSTVHSYKQGMLHLFYAYYELRTNSWMFWICLSRRLLWGEQEEGGGGGVGGGGEESDLHILKQRGQQHFFEAWTRSWVVCGISKCLKLWFNLEHKVFSCVYKIFNYQI